MGVFSILTFLFFVAAFIGLISPKLVLFKWGKNFTRFKTFMLFFILSVSCAIANSVVASRQAEQMKAEKAAEQQRIKAEKVAKEKAEHDKIVADFSSNRGQILSNLKSLINQKQFDSAKKEIAKYDIKPLRADLSDVKKHLKKAALEDKAGNTPDSGIEASLKIYSELVRIEPENEVYKEKLAHYKAKLEEKEKEEKEKKRKEAISSLEKELKDVPASEVSKNLKLYRELLKLAPDNSQYKNKVSHYQAKAEELEQEKRRERLKASSHLELLSWKWSPIRRYAVAEGEVKKHFGQKIGKCAGCRYLV